MMTAGAARVVTSVWEVEVEQRDRSAPERSGVTWCAKQFIGTVFRKDWKHLLKSRVRYPYQLPNFKAAWPAFRLTVLGQTP